ncbi:hypothetical protein [Kitasatospora sp. NPDC004531]
MRRVAAVILGAVAFAVVTTPAQADSFYGTTSSVDELNLDGDRTQWQFNTTSTVAHGQAFGSIDLLGNGSDQ